jgi:hypothetical protein
VFDLDLGAAHCLLSTAQSVPGCRVKSPGRQKMTGSPPLDPDPAFHDRRGHRYIGPMIELVAMEAVLYDVSVG